MKEIILYCLPFIISLGMPFVASLEQIGSGWPVQVSWLKRHKDLYLGVQECFSKLLRHACPQIPRVLSFPPIPLILPIPRGQICP